MRSKTSALWGPVAAFPKRPPRCSPKLSKAKPAATFRRCSTRCMNWSLPVKSKATSGSSPSSPACTNSLPASSAPSWRGTPSSPRLKVKPTSRFLPKPKRCDRPVRSVIKRSLRVSRSKAAEGTAPYTHLLHWSQLDHAQPIPPHPGPLPEEREKHRPTLEHCQDIRFADRLATILPLLGERAGVRGNGLRMVQLAPVQEMRVMCSALCRFRFRQYRTLRWRNFVNRGCS